MVNIKGPKLLRCKTYNLPDVIATGNVELGNVSSGTSRSFFLHLNTFLSLCHFHESFPMEAEQQENDAYDPKSKRRPTL